MSQQDDLKNAVNQAASRGKITPGSQSIVIANLHATNLPATIGGGQLDLGTACPSIVEVAVDKSGSMRPHERAMLAALNALKDKIKEQALKIGFEVHLAYTAFDDTISSLRPFEDVLTMSDLENKDYKAGGATNLYGAIYQGLLDTMAYGSLVYVSGAIHYQQFLIVMTDGMPEGPQSKTKDEVRNFILEFASKPNSAIVLIGFGDQTIYTRLAQELGIANVRAYDPNNPDWLEAMVWDVSSNISHHSQHASQGQTVSGKFFVIPPAP